MQDNQQITFLTDGGEDIRDLPLHLNSQSEHLLDWFYITMRLTVLGQMAKGLPPPDIASVAEELERLKWLLWHGNVFRALQTIDDIQFDLENIEEPDAKQRKLLKTITEFGGYISANAGHIPRGPFGIRPVRRRTDRFPGPLSYPSQSRATPRKSVKRQECPRTRRALPHTTHEAGKPTMAHMTGSGRGHRNFLMLTLIFLPNILAVNFPLLLSDPPTVLHSLPTK